MKKLIAIVLAAVFVLAGCSANLLDPTLLPAAADEQQTAELQSTAEPTSEATLEPTEKPKAEAAYEITYQNVFSWVNSIGTTHAQIIVEITNTGGEPLYLSSGSYDLEDTFGNLIASKKYISEYPIVLLPGEKGYMHDETMLDNPAPESGLVVVPRISAELAKIEHISLTISDVAITDKKYLGINVLGRVENTTADPQSMVYIVMVLYDADGIPLGVMFTILTDEIAAGDKIGFEMTAYSMPDTITADDVGSYVVYAYPLQYQF